MKKQLFTFLFMLVAYLNDFAQVTNIYQPNGVSTVFGRTTADSSNYYTVLYPNMDVIKIDPNNNATILCTLTGDPNQTMIFNNGKGIYPVSNGSPFKLFDGTIQTDITGGQLPMAGTSYDKIIAGDYFHIGNYTYFRTSEKIYKTDYSSASSIQVLATTESSNPASTGIFTMFHMTNSIIFQDIVDAFSGKRYIKRIDLLNGVVTKIDSCISPNAFDLGLIYNNEYYYCSPSGKTYKISDNGNVTILYTENGINQDIKALYGVTPNGVIAIAGDVSGNNKEFVVISAGTTISLNHNIYSNSYPASTTGVGPARIASSLVYFEALDTLSSVSNFEALWVTDGTLTGTKKIMGGQTFHPYGLNSVQSQGHGSEHCGNDLFFRGSDGTQSGVGLIHVNGNNYSHQTYLNIGSPVDLFKIGTSIAMIAYPSSGSAEKAVFKSVCFDLNNIEESNFDMSSFSVYPNPTNEVLNIELETLNNKNAIIQIVNSLGQIVFSQKIESLKSIINISHFNSGIYFIKLIEGNKTTVKKIIIQ